MRSQKEIQEQFIDSFSHELRGDGYGRDSWHKRWVGWASRGDRDYRESQAHFIFTALADIDPSGSQKYLQNLCSWYLKNKIPAPCDLETIKLSLATFHTSYHRAISSQRAIPPIHWNSPVDFAGSVEVIKARAYFLDHIPERQARDSSFIGTQQARLAYSGADGIRVYEVKTVEADDAFSAGMHPSRNPLRRREYRSNYGSYDVPYFQVEMPDGARLRTNKGSSTVPSLYGTFLLDESDRELNLHAFLIRYPQLTESFAPFIQSRLKKAAYSSWNNFTTEEAPLDWDTIILAGKITAFQKLVTPEILDMGVNELRHIRRFRRGLASKELKALAKVDSWREQVPPEIVRRLFKAAASNRQIGVTQNMLSVIATVPEWIKAISRDDLKPLFAGLSTDEWLPQVTNPLCLLIYNLAALPRLQGAGEERFLNSALSLLAKGKEWKKAKAILARGVKNEDWGQNISFETRNMLSYEQDNAAKAHGVDVLLERLTTPRINRQRRLQPKTVTLAIY